MTSPNFKTLLRKNADEIKRPEPLPEGSYRGIIKSREFGQSSKKKTDFVAFSMMIVEAMDGVDSDDLEASLQGKPITDKKLTSTFYITEEALFRLKEFLSSLGMDTSGRSLEELIEEAINKEVLIEVTKRFSEDGTVAYNDVGKVTGIGE